MDLVRHRRCALWPRVEGEKKNAEPCRRPFSVRRLPARDAVASHRAARPGIPSVHAAPRADVRRGGRTPGSTACCAPKPDRQPCRTAVLLRREHHRARSPHADPAVLCALCAIHAGDRGAPHREQPGLPGDTPRRNAGPRTRGLFATRSFAAGDLVCPDHAGSSHHHGEALVCGVPRCAASDEQLALSA